MIVKDIVIFSPFFMIVQEPHGYSYQSAELKLLFTLRIFYYWSRINFKLHLRLFDDNAGVLLNENCSSLFHKLDITH